MLWLCRRTCPKHLLQTRVATAAPGARQAAGAARPRGLPAAGGGDRGPGGCSWDLLSASAASTGCQLAGDKQGEEAQRSQHRAQHPPDARVPLGVAGFLPSSFGAVTPRSCGCQIFWQKARGAPTRPGAAPRSPPWGAPGVIQGPGTGGSGRGAPGAAAAASPALGASQPSRDAAAFGRAPGTGGPAAGGPGGGGGSRGRPRPAPPPPPAPSPAPPEPRPQPGPGVREGPEGQRSE